MVARRGMFFLDSLRGTRLGEIVANEVAFEPIAAADGIRPYTVLGIAAAKRFDTVDVELSRRRHAPAPAPASSSSTPAPPPAAEPPLSPHRAHPPRLTEEERARCKQERLCLRCRLPGHQARNCPSYSSPSPPPSHRSSPRPSSQSQPESSALRPSSSSSLSAPAPDPRH